MGYPRDILWVSLFNKCSMDIPKSEICQKSRVSKCVLRLLWKAKSVEPKSQPALLPRGWLGGILSR